MSEIRRSNSFHEFHASGFHAAVPLPPPDDFGFKDLNANSIDDFDLNELRKSCEDVEDGLHRGNSSMSDLIEKTPEYLLVDTTPEGHRRIRGQKRKPSEDPNNNWGNKQILSPRGAFIPYPNPDVFAPVELQVTNLDQSVDQKEMKRLITGMFREHVNILHVSVFFQSDGNMASCVRVPSLTDAQYAISQLHRKKVGYKRILISHSHSNSQNPAILRSKIISILKEVPEGKIQLFKFREMFEKRFHDSIGVSDLYKMKDLVSVNDDSDGRMVQLTAGYQLKFGTGSDEGSAPAFVRSSAFLNEPLASAVPLDPAFCPIHSAAKDESVVGWAEKENGTLLPNVNISLSVLGPNVKQLIKSHGGSLPLASLTVCYAAIFGEGSLPVDAANGVPLEHLASCVRGVQVTQAASGSKRLLLLPTPGLLQQQQPWSSNKSMVPKPEDLLSEAASALRNFSPFSGSGSCGGGGSISSPMASSNSSSTSSSLTNLNQIPFGSGYYPGSNGGPAAPLAGQLSLFTRELVDLLKATPDCRMPFHKFIPSYHHHFGRQCRVADYGYTKLKDLFEALPHVLQILGEGRSRAIITLSHRAQVKRFTSDLLRVLKSQASKQVSLTELPAAFDKTLNRKFKISDYGVCDVEDILQEVSETSVVLSGEGDDVMIAIPKREQTQDEMERTHHFAQECIELLRHAPECRLPFNKFVPAYHHHFGRQCRVADYGFTKLIELFEAIPFTVEITEDAEGERLLQLTDGERLNVLGGQIESLMVDARKQVIPLSQLEEMYRRQYGYPLRPDDYCLTSVVAIMKNLPQTVRVDEAGDDDVTSIRLIDRTYVKALTVQAKEILSDEPKGKMALTEFEAKYRARFKSPLETKDVKGDLSDLADFEEGEGGVAIALKPLHLCAVKIQKLLEDHEDNILGSEFEAVFAERYGKPLCPGQYGCPSLNSLIRALPENFAVRGRGPRKMIWYLRDGTAATEPTAAATTTTFRPPAAALPPSRPGSRFVASAAATTRFSTSRHEGFRLVAPARNPRPPPPPSNQIGGGGWAPPSQWPRHPYYAVDRSKQRFPLAVTQQEVDLAQFGLFPGGHNGQMVAGAPAMKSGAINVNQQQHHQVYGYPPYQQQPSNLFLSTPGNASKIASTSPMSPMFGGPSLFPVPHSPLPMPHNGFLSGAGNSFMFPPQSSSSAFWGHYANNAPSAPSTPPSGL